MKDSRAADRLRGNGGSDGFGKLVTMVVDVFAINGRAVLEARATAGQVYSDTPQNRNGRECASQPRDEVDEAEGFIEQFCSGGRRGRSV